MTSLWQSQLCLKRREDNYERVRRETISVSFQLTCKFIVLTLFNCISGKRYNKNFIIQNGVIGLMKGYAVQIIVFFFSGTILFTGIYLVIGGDIEKTPISIVITIFTVGLLLTIIAAVNPYEILELTYGKFHLKRYQPAQKEREEAIKMAADNPVEISAEEKERLIKAAEHRTDEIRSPEDYLVLATEAWREKNYDNALKFAFIGLNLEPYDIRVKSTLTYRIGIVYKDLKIYDLAIKYFKNALEGDPKFSWPHIGFGSVYLDQKKYSEAEKEYKNAIKLDPKLAMPHNNLGILYQNQKRYTEAEEEFKKAIELDPGLTTIHNNLGLFHYAQKNYAEAEQEYKKAIELDSKDAAPHNNLGTLYGEQKKYAEAEKEYKKAIVLDPNLKTARENLKNLQAFI